MTRSPRKNPGKKSAENVTFDKVDRHILDILQGDSDRPINSIAEEVGLSPTPCWRRVKRLEDAGVIQRRVAIVDQRRANVPMTIFVGITAPRHAKGWLTDFHALIERIPEVVEAYRLTGDTDYILKIVVPDIDHYDLVYKTMIDQLDFSQVSASISMEELKFTTAIPTKYL
ncbi:Lrp/AsnC family transcriptional regulator [Hoeflea prorocentri]|uniref:Lrp/AsnC family transcriptional regulator n=1 Tax=Hoeflea prorocentri TaxID=1922333 RepID=A0A9X3UNT4_9HYPH|nr:Lrp/AsnC family transcriptional regulator [Hoeflea prorocentri]MCY6382654.1 Lrp/AsnC family transcriptional regulator [Hoeflea prorocentri]MDA5400454.1 Lrp/AsnC family transcriptional regulator [Hoeflea prorocentri]